MSNSENSNSIKFDPSLKPVVLLIIDGFGVAPPSEGNLFFQAKTPFIAKLISSYPATTLVASGEHIGLLPGEAGNCMAGHLALGCGRLILQNLIKINKAIASQDFFSNPILLNLAEHVLNNKSSLHLIGLLSDKNKHSSSTHLLALLDFCARARINNIFLHLCLDGVDADLRAGANLIRDLEEKISKKKNISIATIAGRSYAMDREANWDMVNKEYNAIMNGNSDYEESLASLAILQNYENSIFDDKIPPTVISNFQGVKNGDALLFFNFRGDFLFELASAFTRDDFDKFQAEKRNNLFISTITDYGKEVKSEIIFPYATIKNHLASVLADHGLSQCYITESEKYSHLNYFFRGRNEENIEKSEFVLIPSEASLHHFENPSLKVVDIAKAAANKIISGEYDFLAVNLVNPDVIAHIGDVKALKKALSAVDKAVAKIVKAVLLKNGVVIMTADHGNAEEMFYEGTKKIKKEHSVNSVPFIIVSEKLAGKIGSLSDIPANDLSLASPRGNLSDVAPTILKIMGIEKPEEMTGKSLI